MKTKETLNKTVLFTESYIATQREVDKAQEVGAKIVCGMYGDDYTREVESAYGRVPKHLMDKRPVAKVQKKKSPEIINPPGKKPTVKKATVKKSYKKKVSD